FHHWMIAQTFGYDNPQTAAHFKLLASHSPGESAGVVAAFRQDLGETGFVEGQNLAIAFRFGHDRVVPGAAALAYLVNPSSPSEEIYAREAPVVSSALGIRIPVLNASTEHDLDDAFASLGKTGVDALVIPPEPFFDSQCDRIVALAARYAVPMIAGLREYVVAGGLMSYGASLPDSYHPAGI